MESLNNPCQNCQSPMNGGIYRMPHVCPHCLFVHEDIKGGRRRKNRAVAKAAAPEYPNGPVEVEQQEVQEQLVPEPPEQTTVEPEPIAAEIPPAATESAPAKTVVLSTKAADEHPIAEVLEEITAECVLKVELTSDLISNGKFVGQKSEKVKAAVTQGKKHALAQLREKAQKCGSNVVTNVAVKNAIRKADAKHINIIVRATGTASIIETAETAGQV